jgi:hypothetical protein
MSVEHFLVTRFNVRLFTTIPGWKDKARAMRANEAWLRERIKMFERFCLPSVTAQSNKNFRWLIYADEKSPHVLRRHARAWRRTLPKLEVRWVEKWDRMDLIKLLRASHNPWVATTRLDSDDAIHKNFFETLREHVQPKAAAYNFLNGYRWADGYVIPTEAPSNPFITLVERTDESMKSVYVCNHRLISRHAPLKLIQTPPFWISTYHQGSLTRGHKVARTKNWFPAARIKKQFGLP